MPKKHLRIPWTVNSQAWLLLFFRSNYDCCGQRLTMSQDKTKKKLLFSFCLHSFVRWFDVWYLFRIVWQLLCTFSFPLTAADLCRIFIIFWPLQWVRHTIVARQPNGGCWIDFDVIFNYHFFAFIFIHFCPIRTICSMDFYWSKKFCVD